MRCRPPWSLSTLGSKHACDKNRRSSVTYASISVFLPRAIPSSRTTKYVVCCCCLHIKSRSDLYSVPSNIRTGRVGRFLRLVPGNMLLSSVVVSYSVFSSQKTSSTPIHATSRQRSKSGTRQAVAPKPSASIIGA